MVLSIQEVAPSVQPLIANPKGQEKKLGKAAQRIIQSCHDSSCSYRIQVIANLVGLFTSNRESKAGIVQLKKLLAGGENHKIWKARLLSSNYAPLVKISYQFVKYNNSLTQGLTIENRLHFFPAGPVYGAAGSSFSTNKQHRLNTDGSHVLDGLFSATCSTSVGRFDGYAVALGDGAGGHFGEARQDQQIARVVHVATKGAVRLTSAYHSPAELWTDLDRVVDALKLEVERKVWGEGTTLLCCRFFPESEGYRLVGFAIGDNLLASWSPSKKEIVTLEPSVVSDAGTAIFPTVYRSFEVRKFNLQLPFGTFVFGMTDGAHDNLPHEEKQSTYQNGLMFRQRSLKNWDLSTTETEASTVETLLKKILRKSLATLDQQRQDCLSTENVQLGDDIGIWGLLLERPGR